MREEVAAHDLAIDVRTEEEKQDGAPEVLVRITDLGESGINLRAYVWTQDALKGYQALSDLRYSVKRRFDEEKIEIPFPYTNVF